LLFGDIRQAETTVATCTKVEVCVTVRRHNAKPYVCALRRYGNDES
jgi:hypothetical protein